MLDYGSHGVTPVLLRRISEFLQGLHSNRAAFCLTSPRPNPAALHLNPPGGSQVQSRIPQDHVSLLSFKGIDKGSGCSFALKNSRLFLLQDKDSLNDNMIPAALANTFLGTLYPFRTFHKRFNSALPSALLAPGFPDLK